MSADHHSYEEIAHERRGSAEYREGYAEARRALADRRTGAAKRVAAARLVYRFVYSVTELGLSEG